MTGGRLPVQSIVETIHRRAKWAGTPSIVITLVDQASSDDINESLKLSPVEIGDEARRRKSRHAVITGAEPCVYDLEPLTRALIGRAFTVQVETSGRADIRVWRGAWVTLTPRPGGTRRLTEAAFERASEIQMLVEAEADIETLRELLKSGKPRDRVVWLLPASDAALDLCRRAATLNHWRVVL